MYKGRAPVSKERGYRTGGAALMASLALAACGGGSETTVNTQAIAIEAEAQQNFDASSLKPRPEGSVLVVDTLSSDIEKIKMYAGPYNTPKDVKPVAALEAGEAVTAECKVEGRVIQTDDRAREDRVSNEWVRVRDVAHRVMYASIVYAQDPESLSPQLLECK